MFQAGRRYRTDPPPTTEPRRRRVTIQVVACSALMTVVDHYGAWLTTGEASVRLRPVGRLARRELISAAAVDGRGRRHRRRASGAVDSISVTGLGAYMALCIVGVWLLIGVAWVALQAFGHACRFRHYIDPLATSSFALLPARRGVWSRSSCRAPSSPLPKVDGRGSANRWQRHLRPGSLKAMPVHPPIARRYVAPTEEHVAASRAEAERYHAELEAKRLALRPARCAAILTGPVLVGVDAAVECHCSYHPRPADVDLHDGGVTCPCQLTPDERRRNLEGFLAEMASYQDDPEMVAAREEERRSFVDVCTELGVQARVKVSAAPFVIIGTCDGRGFYLRERHGNYRVTIAPDDDPSSDPWSADASATSIDIASGDEREFLRDGAFSSVEALRVAVAAARTALARNACAHARAGENTYCPECGAPANDADAWRWSNDL